MACVYPIDCWREMNKNENGKYAITFNIRKANLDKPLQVPCGKCIGCYKTKSIEWGIRCFQEASLHEQNSFVTLTYDDNHCPVLLDKLHLSQFMRKLRDRGTSLRYFAAGEYGTKTRRPHYHALIFGQDFLANSYPINDKLYLSEIVNDTWGMGFTSVGPVTMESCMYVAGYATKKLGDKDTFNLMSRRPGIGHTWLDKYKNDLSNTGIITVAGQELQIPKRYLQWEEQELEHIKEERQNFFDNLTPAQVVQKRANLRSLEINMTSKLQQRVEKI